MEQGQQTAGGKSKYHWETAGKPEHIIAQKERRTENGARKPAETVLFMGVVML